MAAEWPSPDVADALNVVYKLLIANELQAHMQEHMLESEGYQCIADWFHCIEEKGHRAMIHPLLNRINALGGEPESELGFRPEAAFPVEQLDKAVDAQIARLTEIRTAYVEACEVADEVDDYVTEKQIWEQMEWLEKRIGKFKDRAAQIADLGLEEFLAEKVD